MEHGVTIDWCSMGMLRRRIWNGGNDEVFVGQKGAWLVYSLQLRCNSSSGEGEVVRASWRVTWGCSAAATTITTTTLLKLSVWYSQLLFQSYFSLDKVPVTVSQKLNTVTDITITVTTGKVLARIHGMIDICCHTWLSPLSASQPRSGWTPDSWASVEGWDARVRRPWSPWSVICNSLQKIGFLC